MAAYLIVATWLVSNIVCLYLVKRRNVEPGVVLRIVGALLGPLAIPLVYTLKTKVKI